MRGAMICVSVMLAIVLAWPSVFGSTGRKSPVLDIPVPVKAAAPAFGEQTRKAASAGLGMLIPPASAKPESCERHHSRAIQACGSDTACQAAASDKWDLCQATGVWPN